MKPLREFGESPLPPTMGIGQDWTSVTAVPQIKNIQEYAAQVYLPKVGLRQLPWSQWMIDQTGRDDLFLSALRCWSNSAGLERLRTLTRGIEYDASLQGYWIERNSTAHSLANLLGFELYDPKIGPSIKNPRPQRDIWSV